MADTGITAIPRRRCPGAAGDEYRHRLPAALHPYPGAGLELALNEIRDRREGDDVLHDVYRAARVKEFELILEQSRSLLRKRLAAFFASNRQADRLHFRDLFRHAARHGLLEPDAVERWLEYRDNRNDTAHNCGERFAEATLKLLPAFLADARALADTIDAADDD